MKHFKRFGSSFTILIVLMPLIHADFMVKGNKTQMKDLNEDVQFLIFEHLELNDLLAVAETNRLFAVLSANIFARKYSTKLIELNDLNPTSHVIAAENDDGISVNSYEIFSRILKKFGWMISKVAIKHCAEGEEDILKSINLYCGDALDEFKIDSFKFELNHLYGLGNPFKNVVNLSLRGRFRSTTNPIFTFAELFPNLRSLSLNFIQITEPTHGHPQYILQHLPNLEQLFMQTRQFAAPKHIDEAFFLEILGRNRQIYQLILDECNRELLETIDQMLPDLTSLELHHYSPSLLFENTQKIAFINVTTFTIVDSFESAPNNVDFENLVEYRAHGLMGHCNKWLEIVEDCPNLKRVYVYQSSVNNEEVARLAEVSSNLTEIYLSVNRDVNDELIVKLVKNSGNLRKMELFSYYRSFELVADRLQTEFGEKFTIVESRSKLFIELL